MKKPNNLIYLIIGLVFSFMCVLCFAYYSRQFLFTILENKETFRWLIFGFFILGAFGFGIVNFVFNNKLLKENIQLRGLLEKLSDDINSHYYSTLEYIQNSREISLDVLNELKEKP